MSTHAFPRPAPEPSAFDLASAEFGRAHARQRRRLVREWAGLYHRTCPCHGILRMISEVPVQWLLAKNANDPVYTRQIIRALKRELRLARATRGEWWRAHEVISRQMMLLAAIGAELATLKAQTRLREIGGG